MAALAVGLVAGASTMVTVAPMVKAEAPPFVVVDRWRPSTLPPGVAPGSPEAQAVWTETRLFAEQTTGKLFALARDASWVSAYRLDTLQPLGAGYSFAGTSAGGVKATWNRPTGVLADGRTGGLLVAFDDVVDGVETASRVWIDQLGADNGGTERVATLDLSSALKGRRILGLYRVPGTGIVYLIADSVSRSLFTTSVGGGVTVVELDVSRGLAAGVVDWVLDLPACYAPFQRDILIPPALGFVATKQSLYFGCSNKDPALTLTVPVARGVAGLALGADPRQGPTPAPTADALTIFGRDGNFSSGESHFDPGSGRFALTAITQGALVVGFDTTSDTYTGVAKGGGLEEVQSGVDPLTGRYYGLGGDGLRVTDLRATPLGQGTVVESLKDESNARATVVSGPIAVDSRRRRVFLHYASQADTNKPQTPPFFAVVEDRLPPYIAPPTDDPDAATADVDEQPGRTTVNFGADAHGYGSRVRQIGGAKAMVVNYAGIDVNPFPVGPGTRELRFASDDFARLADGEASAGAISVDRDRANTQADLNNAGDAGAWQVHPATCIDLAGTPTTQVVDQSRTTCDADNAVTLAGSVSQPVVLDNLRVEAGTVDAALRRDRDDGAVASMTATARGIDVLGGALHIGKVEVAAEASAHGRPGTARSTYQRKLSGVVINGVAQCGTECDAESIARRVNEGFAGRVHIEFPDPDASARATPRGYAAGIRRDAAAQLEEIILNEQPPDRAELPGMVITVQQDVNVPSRMVVELAAVQLDVHYGISLTGGDVADGSAGVVDLLGRPLGDGATGSGGLATPPFGPGGAMRPTGSARLRAAGLLEDPGAFIANSVKVATRLLLVWALLLMPVYLSARRRLLLQRWLLPIGAGR